MIASSSRPHPTLSTVSYNDILTPLKLVTITTLGSIEERRSNRRTRISTGHWRVQTRLHRWLYVIWSARNTCSRCCTNYDVERKGQYAISLHLKALYGMCRAYTTRGPPLYGIINYRRNPLTRRSRHCFDKPIWVMECAIASSASAANPFRVRKEMRADQSEDTDEHSGGDSDRELADRDPWQPPPPSRLGRLAWLGVWRVPRQCRACP